MKILNTVVLLILIIGAASCSAPKRIIYFNETTPVDSVYTTQALRNPTDIIIQTNDIISVNVTSETSLTPKTDRSGNLMQVDEVMIYNSGGSSFSTMASSAGGGGSGGGAQVTNAYTVDKDGNINYSILGTMKVGGLTLKQVNELLATRLSSYLKNPVVESRIVNYKVTVLGEVAKPGLIIAPNQKISIIEALAVCGDIPLTGRKDNVQVIREVDGHREFAYLNLNSKEVFKSPYFYLKQNDIIYVEPSRIRRQESNEFFRFYLPALTSLISAGALVYSISKLN